MGRTARSSRLEVRVASDEKEIIEKAATLTGSNVTDFVRSTMLARARDMVRAHEVIKLTTESSRIFVEALANPPEPNENLRALLERESGAVPGR